MGKVSESEREALRHSAEAALAILPKLDQERAELDERIASLRAVVAAHEAMSGKRPKKLVAAVQVSAGDADKPQEARKTKRGQVYEHVDAILSGGADYPEPDIRQMIAQRFNVVYGRSTVYAALRRGREAGKYEQKERRWRMKVA